MFLGLCKMHAFQNQRFWKFLKVYVSRIQCFSKLMFFKISVSKSACLFFNSRCFSKSCFLSKPVFPKNMFFSKQKIRYFRLFDWISIYGRCLPTPSRKSRIKLYVSKGFRRKYSLQAEGLTTGTLVLRVVVLTSNAASGAPGAAQQGVTH